jgi:carbon monoxide dehydrogenase subunit G
VQKVGPVKATFKGAVTLSDIVEGQSLMLSGEGKGGAAGFAKGSANVTLSDQDGGTLLSYEVEAKVGGKLAQLGSRIIDGFAKKMADQFFENFRSAVEGPSDEETKEDTAEKKGWFKKIIG